MINSGDCSSQTAELLVGAGFWTGEQLELVSIGSIDNCAFGGFQLPGWVDGNGTWTLDGATLTMIEIGEGGEDEVTTATYSGNTLIVEIIDAITSDEDCAEMVFTK